MSSDAKSAGKKSADKPVSRPKRAKKGAATEGPKALGRPKNVPALLKPELIDAICRNLELGMSNNIAAEAEGISRSTMFDWMNRGAKGVKPYAAFHERVTRARAKGAKTLTELALAGEKGSSQATWLLERRYREDYGSVQRLEHTGADGGPIASTFDRDISAEVRKNPSALVALQSVFSAVLGRKPD